MDPFTIGAIGANLVGGLLGNDQASADRAAAKEAALATQKLYQNIDLPDIEKMKLNPALYGIAGELTPEQMSALALSQQDQLSDVQLDPRLKSAQMDALSFMQQTGQTGLTPQERAQVNNLRRQTEADNQSRMQALLQGQDARGVGSSDMGLAARMIEAQSSANRQAQSTDDIAGQAFQRALQSMSQAGSLAGNMESADYSRQAQLAQAQREREMANWSNQQNVANQNTQNRNSAQQFNLNNSQRVKDQNTGLTNQTQKFNSELQQRKFENELSRAGGISSGNAQASQAHAGSAAQTAGMWGGIGKGVGEMLSGFSDDDNKTKNKSLGDFSKFGQNVEPGE